MAELAAIGLVSNILQFVEYGIVLVKKYRELRKSTSGITKENEVLEEHTLRFRELLQPLGADATTPMAVSSEERKAEQQFRRECDKVAADLLERINTARLTRNHNMLATVKYIFLDWNKHRKDITDIQLKLEDLRRDVVLYALKSLRNQQSSMFIALQHLLDANQSLEANSVQKLEAIEKQLRALAPQAQAVVDREKKRKVAKVPASYSDADETKLMGRVCSEFDNLVGEASNVRKQQVLLDSLRFREIHFRQSKIKEAHERTFEWVFSSEHHNFMHWLEEGQGLYWIRGKPGSGKSTLMRFIAAHPRTRTALESWADGQQLVVASHFFWIAGQPVQRSRAGLIRTLLFQVLRKRPHLLATLCPSRWAQAGHVSPDPWSDRELAGLLRDLTQHADSAIKFCFFVDGLDEYTGGAGRNEGAVRYDELLRSLKDLCASADVKICVSSRPWNAFDDAFGASDMQLKVEDLTYHDIDLYVRDQLGSSKAWQEMCRTDHRCHDIVNEIVRRAEGVFLWVYLVVDSLLLGISNTDTYVELRKRLDQLPSDLEQYFKHMLRGIEEVYWDQSVRIFRTAIDAAQSLPLLAYDILEREQGRPDYALELSDQSASELDFADSFVRMKKRLRARCGDLLEITFNKDEALFMGHRVDFLHRTVRDFFLETPALDNIVRERGPVGFDSYMSLSRIMLALTKIYHVQGRGKSQANHVFALADSMMYYTWRMEKQTRESAEGGPGPRLRAAYGLLEALDRVNDACMKPRRNFHWTNHRDSPTGTFGEEQQKDFLSSAIQARLQVFVQTRLGESPSWLSKKGRPLLDYALRPAFVTPTDFRDAELDAGPVPAIADVLLQAGADPNKPIYIYDGQTPWLLFLRACADYGGRHDDDGGGGGGGADASLAAENIHLAATSMLRHGANAGLAVRDAYGEKRGIVETLRSCGLAPRQLAEMERLVAQKRREQEASGWFPWLWRRSR